MIIDKNCGYALLFCLCCFCSLNATAQDSAWIRSHYYKIERYVPARDGVKLFTSIYVPIDSTKPHPILITRTPYSCAPYGEEQWFSWWKTYQKAYLREGYIMVKQDIRGAYMSEGKVELLRPYKEKGSGDRVTDESTDTYDLIDWLVKNIPHNNGRVGLIGISANGFYATQGAVCGHSALKAVSPQAPVTDGFMGDDLHHNGAFFLADTYGFLVQAGIGRPRPQPTIENAKGSYPFTADAYDFYLRMGALRNFTRIAEKDSVALWSELMKHPNLDNWWKVRNTRTGLYSVKPAMLVVGGFFDAEDLYGALHVYKAIEEQSPATINKLVMGPWFHGQWARDEGSRLGHVQFGSKTSGWYQDNLELPFFNHYLLGRGQDSIAEATVFFTGENKWRRFDKWPQTGLSQTKLYLRGSGRLDIAASASRASYDSYLSDPARPVPYIEGIHSGRTREYMIDDQRFASTRTDVLVYQTEELKEDLTLGGPLTTDLHVSTSGTDADFVVKLIDVFPDDFEYPDSIASQDDYIMNGYQMLVRGDVFRGKYRNSFEKPEPFLPGKITRVKFNMNDVAHTFKKGHRIMIQVQSSWFPLVDRNPQVFTDIYTCDDKAFKKATIHIYHDAGHASNITLPVLK